MKTQLQKALFSLCPSVCIQTIWSRDNDAVWDVESDSLDPDDYEAWQSEIKASAIIQGEMISASEYLCGTWEKAGDNPAISNPEISGYELQMTQDALIGLRLLAPRLSCEIDRTCDYITRQMQDRYDKQMKQHFPALA